MIPRLFVRFTKHY